MAFFQTTSLWVNQLADGVVALVLDTPGGSLNQLTPEVLHDIETALDRIADEPSFRLLVLRSGKPVSFCHGLAANLLDTLPAPEGFVALAEQGQRVCAKLSDLPQPSVAVIAGGCLGAGLELALACDYRVVVDRPGTVLGFPEAEIGLIPAWGGTQRLPRLVGLERSLLMLIGARRLGAGEAQAWGLADDVTVEGDERPPEFLSEPRKHDWSRPRRHSWRQTLREGNPIGRWLVLRGAGHILRERLPDDLPAPWEVLEAVRIAGRGGSLEDGLTHERAALGRLAQSAAFRNLRRLHRLRERRRDELNRLASAAPSTRLAVLGSEPLALTLMAQVIRQGSEIVVRERDKDHLTAVLEWLLRHFGDEVRGGSISQGHYERALTAIRGTYTWTHFDTIDLALDLAFRGAEEQQDLFREMSAQVRPQTVLAVGRLVQPMAPLREGIAQPGRVVGLRFAEPLGKGSLVEVAYDPTTDAAATQRVIAWAAGLGYTPLLVADRPGLLVLRVLLAAINEAALLVREGLTIRRVDQALRRFGFAHGPLEHADRIGLDRIAEQITTLAPTYTGRIAFETGFALLAKLDWTGETAGLGFYRHSRHGRRPRSEVERLWRRQSQGEAAAELPPFSDSDQVRLAQRRVVALVVNEAVRCLDEGVVPDKATLDFALCLAFWPPHRGGPLCYARQQGPAALAAECRELARKYGPRFEPPSAWDAVFASAVRDS